MNGKKMKFTFSLISMLLLFALAACGGTAVEPTAGGTPDGEQEAVEPTTVDMGDVTDEAAAEGTPQEMPEPGIPRPDVFMTEQAKADLAQRLSIDVSAVEEVNVEEMEWSDASLGCPEEGMSYAQVITPGFQITLRAEGETYTYHTGMESNLVLCGDDGRPVETTR
jgi:hypothetical protein